MYIKRISVVLGICLLVLLFSTQIFAEPQSSSIEKTFINNSAASRTDLHIEFNGPVDANSDVSGDYSPFTAKTNSGSNVIVFSGGTVPIGGEVGCIKFESTMDGLQIVSATWTPGDIVIPDDDIKVCRVIAPVPSLTEWGMIALVVLLLAAGVVIIRRRKLPVRA
jgi:hypothetical protein